MAIKRVLVTGSSGTIGTRLCEKMLAAGYEVVGVDWKENRWNDDVADITRQADLRDYAALEKAVTGTFDLTVHLAANARVFNLVRDPRLAQDNFNTLFNVLEFSRRNGVPRFMFASSREVYGNSEKIMHSEDEAYVQNCESPYTASKVGGEALVHSYRQCYPMDCVIFRFSNVYGMYDSSDRIIPLFIKLCRDNRDLTVFGKEKLLDFTYIDDTVAGIMLGVERFADIRNDVFNLAYGQGSSLLEVAQLMKEFVGSSNRIIIEPNRTGEVVKYIADIAKAKAALGYAPLTTIVEGVKKSVEWYTAHPEALTDL